MQFGHAGSCANADAETADAKNKALKEAGAHIPKSFDELGNLIRYDTMRQVPILTLISLQCMC